MWRITRTKLDASRVSLNIIRLLVLCVGVVLVVVALTGPAAIAWEPPNPPDPPGGDPPLPPPDDCEGVEPGNENVILPTAETIVYDSSEPSGELTCTEEDPGTGQPVDVKVANDEILVTFDAQATIEEIESALAIIGAWKKMDLQGIGQWVVGIEPAATCEALQTKIDQLTANPLVLSANKSPLGELHVIHPNDPLYQGTMFTGQWNLRRTGMPEGLPLGTGKLGAWDIERGKGQYATIGIVDTGVQKTHSDLSANLRSDSEAATGSDHGTACTGIAAAVTNNSYMLAGLGWDVRAVTKSGGSLYDQPYVASKVLDIARSSSTTPGGVVAISMSLGYWWTTPEFEKAVNEAFRQNILVVASMGNSGDERGYWPAVYTRTMAVGATDCELNYQNKERRTSFSTYGRHISVVAPGTDIITTTLGNGYRTNFGGTSASSPHVAGLAALVRSEFQSMGPLDIRHRIEDTASDDVAPSKLDNPIPGRDDYTGWGLIRGDDAMAAVNASYTISGNKWHLVAMPVWPRENPSYSQWQASTFPQNVLPSPPGSTRLIGHIKPYTDQYYMQNQYDANGYPLVGLVKPFRAFWVKYTNVSSVNLTAQGASAGLRPAHNLEFRLWRGHNMIGNPFMSNIQFRDANISFRVGNSSDTNTKTLAEAVSAGWVGKCHYWNPDTAAYVRVYPNAGHVMPPYRGYFLYTYIDDLYMIVKR